MMSVAITLKKVGGISFLFLCLCMSISGPVQSQDLVDPVSTFPGSTTSPIPITPGAAQDPTASSTTTGKTTDTKPSGDSPIPITLPTSPTSAIPALPGGTTPAIPTSSASASSTGLNSTNTSSVMAGPGGLPPSLQDGNGKKLVFPISDGNGHVIFQTSSDMQMPGKHGNSNFPSSKLPGNSTDSKGDKNAKHGSKPNSGNLLNSFSKSMIASLSLGIVVIILA